MTHTYMSREKTHCLSPPAFAWYSTTGSMGKQVPFTFSDHTATLDIPTAVSINEHAYRLLEQWHLPVFVLPSTCTETPPSAPIFSRCLELQEALRLFFHEQVQIAADEITQQAVEPLIKGQLEIQTVLDQWFKLVQVSARVSCE